MAKSVYEAAPHLVAEWSPRNTLSPSRVTAGSTRKVSWICENGHEWDAIVSSRVRGRGCPFCAGLRAITGETDLATLHPDLASEWHPTRNTLSPNNVTAGSSKEVWWLCKNGHEWASIIYSRTSGSGCPFCSGRTAIRGETDLATLHPDIARQWHPTRNESGPESVTAMSGRKAFWRCERGHEWAARVAHRTNGSGCPYCSGRRAILGETDLATLRKDLIDEWHPTRNTLNPCDITIGSEKPAWWLCKNGHEWEAIVNNRALGGRGCPYCSGNRAANGENDLVTLRPDIAEQWHPTRNEISPESVTQKSGRKVWWLCKYGHEWEETINNRTRIHGGGCPYCSGHRVTTGKTDLATLRPDVAEQWDYGKNGSLRPQDVTISSGRKVFWRCEQGHGWAAVVKDRTRTDGSATGCPQCAAETFVSRGESELAELIKSWGIDVQTTVRSIPGVREVDILATGSNGDQTAIEFNGLYWHSERFKSRNYHHEKTLTLKNAGFKVVHVWEDDWVLKRPVVEKMLRHKLGVSDAEPVHARKTIVAPVTVDESRQFLEENHIQGYVPGSVRFGLRQNDVLVAVMVFRSRGSNVWELSRYATNAPVRGGFGKLLAAFKREHHPERIVSFSDNLISDGVMYEANGFKNDGAIPPDYMYIVNGKREHKFNYRLRRFRNDPDLEYRDGMTERELAELNGLGRVYDGGKTRWVLEDDRIG